MFKYLCMAVVISISLSSCVSMRSSGVLPLGGNAYTVTAESESNKIKAKSTALREAEQFCLSQGKEVNVVEIQEGTGSGIWVSTDAYTVNFLCN